MNSRRYVICDIEATGLHDEKEIIEIALITYQDGKITDVYETLINPLTEVAPFIQNLTSISQRQLSEAPKFYEVADALRMRLEGNVFVSHNTEFDFELLRKKFLEMGQDLKMKNFCTLKVAQHEIPGLRNYNLDSLCSFFGIKIKERHRALGDAKATLELFVELFKLRLKTYTKIHYLPHHEKALKNITSKSGLLYFRDNKGKVIHFEAAYNMEKRARELLVVKADNRDLLIRTEAIEGELTGSPLIAEFKKLLFHPYSPKWVIKLLTLESGEKFFKLFPYKRGDQGLWFFQDYPDAKAKLKELERNLKTDVYLYRDDGKSKEEILRMNQKIENLAKEARFPNENLIMMGEGRTMGEKSFVLVRGGQVMGYGYSQASEEEIASNPESFITRRFFQHLGVNLTTKRYIRELKNMRQKSDGWRSLAEVR
jgi:DNA polymerase-3 subunit epsilon